MLKLLVPQLVLSAWWTPTVTLPFRHHVLLMPMFLFMTSRTWKLEKMQASILVAFSHSCNKIPSKNNSTGKKFTLAYSSEVIVHFNREDSEMLGPGACNTVCFPIGGLGDTVFCLQPETDIPFRVYS